MNHSSSRLTVQRFKVFKCEKKEPKSTQKQQKVTKSTKTPDSKLSHLAIYRFQVLKWATSFQCRETLECASRLESSTLSKLFLLVSPLTLGFSDILRVSLLKSKISFSFCELPRRYQGLSSNLRKSKALVWSLHRLNVLILKSKISFFMSFL